MLSHKTCGTAIRLLQQFAGSTIDLLIYENELPAEYFTGSSKESRLLNGFRDLESTGRSDLILRFIQAGLKYLGGSWKQELTAALTRDGYVIDGEHVVSDDSIAVELRSAIEVFLEKYSGTLQVEVLVHHLKESEDEFRLEKWDSSIGQARKFVELLLSDIATAASKARAETPDLGMPVKVRDYLQKVGFFDDDERKKLVDGVYGFFSDEGAHPGISTQSAARVCLSILRSFGLYVLKKFEAWKAAGYKDF